MWLNLSVGLNISLILCFFTPYDVSSLHHSTAFYELHIIPNYTHLYSFYIIYYIYLFIIYIYIYLNNLIIYSKEVYMGR